MTSIRQVLRLKEVASSWALESNPGRRALYGAVALILLVAMVSAMVAGLPLLGGSAMGLGFYALVLIASLVVAGRKKRFLFNPNRTLDISTSFFAIPLGQTTVNLQADAEIQVLRILFSTKENGRSLSKLMVHTGETQVFLDESTDFAGLSTLGRALGIATGLPVKERAER